MTSLAKLYFSLFTPCCTKNSGNFTIHRDQQTVKLNLKSIPTTKMFLFTIANFHSTHADSTRTKTNFFSCTIWKTSLCYIDQETQEENLLGGTNSFVGQFLHPCLVQSSRSIPHIQTVQGPKQISSLVQWGSTSVYLADQETQGDIMIALNLFFRWLVNYFSLEVNPDIELPNRFWGHK